MELWYRERMVMTTISNIIKSKKDLRSNTASESRRDPSFAGNSRGTNLLNGCDLSNHLIKLLKIPDSST